MPELDWADGLPQDLVEQIDIPATILDLADLPIPQWRYIFLKIPLPARKLLPCHPDKIC